MPPFSVGDIESEHEHNDSFVSTIRDGKKIKIKKKFLKMQDIGVLTNNSKQNSDAKNADKDTPSKPGSPITPIKLKNFNLVGSKSNVITDWSKIKRNEDSFLEPKGAGRNKCHSRSSSAMKVKVADEVMKALMSR